MLKCERAFQPSRGSLKSRGEDLAAFEFIAELFRAGQDEAVFEGEEQEVTSKQRNGMD